MNLRDTAEQSVTQPDRSRGVAAGVVHPVLAVAAIADALAPSAESRLVVFQEGLFVGRRVPPAPFAGQVWLAPDPLVSSQHFSIVRHEDDFVLRDLGSRNGTAVDGVLVVGPTTLRDGAIVFYGGHVAVFRLVHERDLPLIEEELRNPFGPVASCSPQMATIARTLRRLARSPAEILLAGETGVGKEVYARAIHAHSEREGRFVAINCAALPRELVESELFGYVRGAHSQARDNKRGLIEEAEGGTIFLDEIGEMPPELQPKLLRFLQDRELVPVGAVRGRKVDVRVLAATNRRLGSTMSTGGGLRLDLVARLGAEPIRLPPLRERMEDLGVLASRFLRDGQALEPAALQALALYRWPGNVRELEKVMTTAALLAEGHDRITLRELPAAIGAVDEPAVRPAATATAANRPPVPSGAELEALLVRFEGNIQRVARELDRKPPLIYRWCHRHGLDPDRYRRKTED